MGRMNDLTIPDGEQDEYDKHDTRSICPNKGKIRILPDGTENFCNRWFPERCEECGLNPLLD